MKIQESLFVSRLPEYLVNSKKDQDSNKELLDNVNPTTLNITAALAEKLVEELSGGFNNWSDKDKNTEEFKLDELFEGLGKYFKLEQVELLKGFFRFKGTSTDVQYILNAGGLYLNIYESDFFHETDLKVIASRYDKNGNLSPLINSTFTSDQMNNILLGMVIYLPNEKIDPRSVIDPLLFLSSIGLDEDSVPINDIYSILNDWFMTKITPYKEYDCSISVIIPVSDDQYLEEVGVSTIVNLIKSIVETRLSVCVFLKGITALLNVKDELVTLDHLHDNGLKGEISLSNKDTVKTNDHVSDNENDSFLVENSSKMISNYQVIKYFVDNVNPWMIGGIPALDVPGIELGVSDEFKVESLINGSYVII
jgi:hypothetical protein